MGEPSATGVAFTRNPSTGERAYYGEYLINAQGEDVVAGIRTPQYLTLAAREAARAPAAPPRPDARPPPGAGPPPREPAPRNIPPPPPARPPAPGPPRWKNPCPRSM